jgi:hypothetical protein
MQSSIVSPGLVGPIAALLIPRLQLAAPIFTPARLGTRIVGQATYVRAAQVMPPLPDVGSIVALLLGRAVEMRRRWLLTRLVWRRPSMMLRSRLVWTLVRALKLSWWRLIPRLVQALLSVLVTSLPHIVAERGGACTGRVRAILAMMNAIDSRSVGLVGCASTARVGTRIAAVGLMERVGSGTLAAVAAGGTERHRLSSSRPVVGSALPVFFAPERWALLAEEARACDDAGPREARRPLRCCSALFLDGGRAIHRDARDAAHTGTAHHPSMNSINSVSLSRCCRLSSQHVRFDSARRIHV